MIVSLIGLVVVGLGLRILYILALHGHPLLELSVQSNVFDQARFMELARVFASGQWLGTITEGHFASAYSYIIAICLSVFQQDMYGVFFLQAIIGGAAILVMYRLGVELFDNKVAAFAAAAILTFYGPLIFFEGALLRASLLAYVNLFAFYAIVKAIKGGRLRLYFIGGLWLALSHAIRPGVLIPMVGLYLIIAALRSAKRWKAVAVFALAVVTVLVPMKVRDHLARADQTIESQNMSIFWIGNTHDSSGIGLWRSPLRMQLTREAGGSKLATAGILWREIKAHPGDYAALYYRKFRMFLNGYEIPGNINYYHFQELFPVLKLGWINFTPMFPFFCMGLVCAIRKREQIGLLMVFLLTLSLSVIVFHVQARYRIPSIPFYILIAGRGVSGLVDAIRLSHRKALIGYLVLSGLAMIWALPDQSMIQRYFGSMVRPIDYVNEAVAWHVSSIQNPSDGRVNSHIIEAFQKAYDKTPVKASGLRTDCLLNIAVFQKQGGQFNESKQTLQQAIDVSHRPAAELRQNIIERDVQLQTNPAEYQYLYYF